MKKTYLRNAGIAGNGKYGRSDTASGGSTGGGAGTRGTTPRRIHRRMPVHPLPVTTPPFLLLSLSSSYIKNHHQMRISNYTIHTPAAAPPRRYSFLTLRFPPLCPRSTPRNSRNPVAAARASGDSAIRNGKSRSRGRWKGNFTRTAAGMTPDSGVQREAQAALRRWREEDASQTCDTENTSNSNSSRNNNSSRISSNNRGRRLSWTGPSRPGSRWNARCSLARRFTG